MKKLLLPFILLFTGCSLTIVYAPKDNYNIAHGSINANQENQGSDLKDNQASQESQADIRLPIP